jgi:hypothetical protein
MPPEDDYPTEPVRPREPVMRERETIASYEAGDPMWLAIDDRLRSIRTMLALVAIIALAALGLSIYTLIDQNNDGDGASEARVAALSDRVGRLEGKTSTSESAGADTTNSLAGRIAQKADKQDLQDLSDELDQLKSSNSGGASQSSLTRLSTRVDQLAEQVADLEASSSSSTSP